MRTSRFTESRILEILKKDDAGVPVADLLRKHGISRATYFKWKGKYGWASVPELQRLKVLETENARLKRLVHEQLHAMNPQWDEPTVCRETTIRTSHIPCYGR